MPITFASFPLTSMFSLLLNQSIFIRCLCLFTIFSFQHDARISLAINVSVFYKSKILPYSTSLLKKFIHDAHSPICIFVFTIFFSMHATPWTCTSSWWRCLGFFLRNEVLLLLIRPYKVDFLSHLAPSLNFTSYQVVLISTFHKHHGNQNTWQHVIVVHARL